MGMLMQFVSSGIIGTLCISMGIIATWPSSTFRLFESANTTLNRPMTQTELSLFGSLSSIGALVGIPVAGLTLDRYGRKNLSLVVALAGVLSWVMIVAFYQVEVLLAAVFLSGISGAVVLIVTVYISEICQESIRGAMCAGSMLFYGVGMLVSYLLGGLLDYDPMNYICLAISVVSLAGLFILKETPICLMMKGLEQEAAKSLAFYRSVKPDSKEVLEELNVIRRALSTEMDNNTISEEEKQLKPDSKKVLEKLPLWKFVKKSTSTRTAIYLTITLITASIFQGFVVIQVYAEPLFEEAIPSMSPLLCSVILAIVIVIGMMIGAYFTELTGRRPLMIYATFTTAASCLLLGLQLHLHWGPHWLIAVNIYFFTITYACGGATVPMVLIGEVFAPEVKSLMSMLVIEWAWFCKSIILFIFTPLLKAIGLGPMFYLFSGVSVLTSIYCIFYLPETKGLAIDEIQEKLSGKKRGNVCLL